MSFGADEFPESENWGTEMWDKIDPNIRNAAQAIAESGKYDDAIFAAFRYIEGEIQELAGSHNIGQALLDEAFDGVPPKILISHDARDQRGIKELFSGALSNIRNDRGHKKAPFLPTQSLHECFLYLSFASFLIFLLGKDLNRLPHIQGIRIYGSHAHPRAELRGRNFERTSKVMAEDVELTITRLDEYLLEIVLPVDFCGLLKIETQDKSYSNEIFCDAHVLDTRPDNTYEVISAEIPLFEDPECIHKRTEVVGLMIKANELGREFMRIVPTYPDRYQAGYFVTHGPFQQTSVKDSWYRHPMTGDIRHAWSGALIATPTILSKSNDFVLGGIAMKPGCVALSPGERRTVRVIGWGRSGTIQREIDVTDNVRWENSNTDIAFVKNGIVYSKGLGKTKIECEYEKFLASADVEIGHFVKGERATYFQGVRRLQQIRFDCDDNLYLCNQSGSIYMIQSTGGFREIIRTPLPEDFPVGIDCLAIDSSKTLYANDMVRGTCFRFKWDGAKHTGPESFGTVVKGTKKGIAVDDSGNVFVAVMGQPNHGFILHATPDGGESYFNTVDMPIHLALDKDGNIYTPSVQDKAIHVYSKKGALIHKIFHHQSDSPSDILVTDDGFIYLPLFHSGKVIRLRSDESRHPEVVTEGLEETGGIAMDSKGRLYVANFTGNSIEMIY